MQSLFYVFEQLVSLPCKMAQCTAPRALLPFLLISLALCSPAAGYQSYDAHSDQYLDSYGYYDGSNETEAGMEWMSQAAYAQASYSPGSAPEHMHPPPNPDDYPYDYDAGLW